MCRNLGARAQRYGQDVRKPAGKPVARVVEFSERVKRVFHGFSCVLSYTQGIAERFLCVLSYTPAIKSPSLEPVTNTLVTASGECETRVWRSLDAIASIPRYLKRTFGFCLVGNRIGVRLLIAVRHGFCSCWFAVYDEVCVRRNGYASFSWIFENKYKNICKKLFTNIKICVII